MLLLPPSIFSTTLTLTVRRLRQLALQQPSRASAATPRGTSQGKALTPGTSARRSHVTFFLTSHSPFLTLYYALQSSTHELIRTLADRLGHHGVAIRAQGIFDSAMQRTSMKWGKATKLAAAAALVFAMREQGQGDRTHHVAVSPYSLPLPFCCFDTTCSTPFVFPCPPSAYSCPSLMWLALPVYFVPSGLSSHWCFMIAHLLPLLACFLGFPSYDRAKRYYLPSLSMALTNPGLPSLS